MAEGDVLSIVSGHQAFAAPSGGGGSIAAADTQIVFMDGTDAVGSENLTFEDLGEIGNGGTLGLAAGENGHATITAIGVGAEFRVLASEGDATHVGGELTLESGGSDGQSGGQLNIKAGNDGGGGDGGAILISSGSAADGESGDIDIRPGGAGNSAQGGSVHIFGGVGQTGSGGSVALQAGVKVAGGSHGTVQLYSAGGTYSLELSEVYGFQFFGGLVVLDGLPSTDPGVAGQIYTDGVTSAGVPRALMVSGG